MKDNLIHVCFVIDSSGSMSDSIEDVVGGFERTIKEQSENKDGECIVSLYTFDHAVVKHYLGKPIKDVETIKFTPCGMTALFDGVGTAIDEVGAWLNDMKEEDRPSKNLIVVMTDGGENSSMRYSGKKVKEMIQHQESKYNWSFIYMGADVTESKDAETLGFKNTMYSSKKSFAKNWDLINSSVNTYLSAVSTGMSASDAAATMDCFMLNEATENTKLYEKEIGKKIKK